MRDFQAEAAWLREALRFGVASAEDVASWAENALGESESLEDVFLELSFMRKAHVLDVISLLNSVSSAITTIEVLPAVLGLAHEKVKTEPTYGRALARSLFMLYCESKCCVPEELNLMSWFDDAYSLAAGGTYGSLESVQKEMEDFTGMFKERANNRFNPTYLPPLRYGKSAG
jgi:hypothetical protein